MSRVASHVMATVIRSRAAMVRAHVPRTLRHEAVAPVAPAQPPVGAEGFGLGEAFRIVVLSDAKRPYCVLWRAAMAWKAPRRVISSA